MRTGYAQLPSHGGKAPLRWLFQRMVRLGREVTLHVVSAYGSREMLHRLSDPYWFQAFGCTLGFDWHFSGVTPPAAPSRRASRARNENWAFTPPSAARQGTRGHPQPGGPRESRRAASHRGCQLPAP